MMWRATFLMLAFYGLAVCTIFGMITRGFTSDFAVMAGVFEVTIGIIIVRALWRLVESRNYARQRFVEILSE